jgi:hypothetical protein
MNRSFLCIDAPLCGYVANAGGHARRLVHVGFTRGRSLRDAVWSIGAWLFLVASTRLLRAIPTARTTWRHSVALSATPLHDALGFDCAPLDRRV